MLKLSDRKLKAFKVGKLFEIEKCKCSNASELKHGNIPYVGATNKNNGTMAFCGNLEKTTKGNCIVFVCDGQGSVGYSFYKHENFVGSTTLKVGRNQYINKYNALFITTALDKNRIIYSFGYKRNEERLKNETVFLPVDKDGNPDYDFMEQFIKEREEKKRNEYIEYSKNKLSEIKSTIRENLGGG